MSHDIGVQADPELNVLLSTLSVFGQSVRGFHWNIVGNQFFDLHDAYGKLYAYVNEFIDEVAEQTRMVGKTPDHCYRDYMQKSLVGAAENFTKPEEISVSVCGDLDVIMSELQEQITLAECIGWYGMSHVLRGGLAEFSKWHWQFSAHSGGEL